MINEDIKEDFRPIPHGGGIPTHISVNGTHAWYVTCLTDRENILMNGRNHDDTHFYDRTGKMIGEFKLPESEYYD